jgi:hypothetical protein
MKSTKHLLHPELQVMAEASIITEINDENLQGIRETLDGLRPPLEDEKSFNVTRKEIFIPQDNAPDVRCLLYILMIGKKHQVLVIFIYMVEAIS